MKKIVIKNSDLRPKVRVVLEPEKRYVRGKTGQLHVKTFEPCVARPPSPKPVKPDIVIGNSNKKDVIHWKPETLNNFSIMVTGDSGVGKTQMIKSLIHETSFTGAPICILDFKNDYAPSSFSDAVGMVVHDVNKCGLNFNPFALQPNDDGMARPIDTIYEFAGIMSRVYRLGEQQAAGLRNAIIESYRENGIDPSSYHDVTYNMPFPDFNDIWDKLDKKVRNRLSMLYDLQIFPSRNFGFEDVISKQVIFNLSGLPNEQIRSALAEIIIVGIHGLVMRGEQPRQLTRMLIIDEAWRVTKSARLQHLAREGRSFGVGLIIGSQFPGDLPSDLSGNLDTSINFQNSDPKHALEVSRYLGGNITAESVSNLAQHQAYFKNSRTASVKVDTLPHYKRSL
jgi:GTPase SAR1 family protein